jgi:diaminopimelate decarboxylase
MAVEPGRYLVAESAVLVGGVLGREVRAGAYTLSYASSFDGFPPPTPVFIGQR